ncbi:MAG: hypothetical protein NVS1B6_05290 [Steroidobacteraceae bacterium]
MVGTTDGIGTIGEGEQEKPFSFYPLGAASKLSPPGPAVAGFFFTMRDAPTEKRIG